MKKHHESKVTMQKILQHANDTQKSAFIMQIEEEKKEEKQRAKHTK